MASNGTTQTFAQSIWCNYDASMCVQASYQLPQDILTFAVSTSATGWVGFGIGQGMADADVWLGWNYANQSVVSDRTSVFYRVPTIDSVSLIRVFDNNSTSLASSFLNFPSHNIQVVFSRRREYTGSEKKVNFSGVTNFVFAYSNRPPLDVRKSSSSMNRHDVAGCFEADFVNPNTTGTQPPTSTVFDSPSGTSSAVSPVSSALPTTTFRLPWVGREIPCASPGVTPNSSVLFPSPATNISDKGPDIQSISVPNFALAFGSSPIPPTSAPTYVATSTSASTPSVYSDSEGLLAGAITGITVGCLIIIAVLSVVVIRKAWTSALFRSSKSSISIDPDGGRSSERGKERQRLPPVSELQSSPTSRDGAIMTSSLSSRTVPRKQFSPNSGSSPSGVLRSNLFKSKRWEWGSVFRARSPQRASSDPTSKGDVVVPRIELSEPASRTSTEDTSPSLVQPGAQGSSRLSLISDNISLDSAPGVLTTTSESDISYHKKMPSTMASTPVLVITALDGIGPDKRSSNDDAVWGPDGWCRPSA
ncbi:hypothetical protein BJ742DRAFT_805069 [Cladochytrium replicatum]|nr:hypothetical protein BJ742DRAFT_805069 [Cladochytrium replicatum]